MDMAVAAVIILTLMLFTFLSLTERTFSAQDAILESWQEMEERLQERIRTDLSPLEEETIVVGHAVVEITLENRGDTKLADYEQWDVILQYTGSDSSDNTEWYPYASSGLNRWTDWHDPSDDVFDPSILNPGEELVIKIYVSPPVATGTTNLATIATPNGITVSTVFTH